VALAEVRGEGTSKSHWGTGQSYYGVFEEVEHDLLRVAALLKDRAFEEEQEWRAVSRVVENYESAPILYREGVSMLIPYMNLLLRIAPEIPVALEQVSIGPTPHPEESTRSVAHFLSRNGATPRRGTGYCGIPYRTW
jgi:hypothetical protein